MNQQGMKVKNKERIFSEIVHVPGISRIQIAKACGFSKTTVSLLVDELIRDGYVVDVGSDTQNSGSGRKPTKLYVDTTRHCIVIVNWTKRYVRIGRADLNGKLSQIKQIAISDAPCAVDLLIGEIRTFLLEHCADWQINAVCFILPAMIDEKRETVTSVVLPQKYTENLIAVLKKAFYDYDLAFYNDTACLAYAEKNMNEDCKGDFVYININAGIGAAFVIDGDILGGSGGRTTQFGHFSLDRKGKSCSCGGHGCLEMRVGEVALRERAKECGADGLFDGKQTPMFCDVGGLAAKDDPRALRLIRALAEDFGFAIADLITILCVDHVILGGYARNLGEYFLDEVKASVRGVGFQDFVTRAQLAYSQQDEDSILSGAAWYFMEHSFSADEDEFQQVYGS